MKYLVTMTGTVQYSVIVEAPTADDAVDYAVEAWTNSEDPTHDFHGEGRGVEVDQVEDVNA